MTPDSRPRGISAFTMGIGPLLLCGFAVPVSNSMIFPALSDLQDKYSFSDAGLGFIAASGFLTSFFVQLFLAPLADRGKPKRFVLAALLLASLGSTLFAFGGSLWVFVIARGIAGASLGTSGPAVRAIVANLDKSRSAERLGRLRGVELAGFTGGPLIGALLIEPFGLRGAFLIFGVVALLAFLFVLTRHIPALPVSGESRRPSLELLRRHRLEPLPDFAALVRVFSDFYFGGDPAGDPALWHGFIGDEPLLVDPEFFTALEQAGIAWGFVSGAEPPSARYVLEQRLGLNDPPLIAMGDAPDKPDPAGLLQLAGQLLQRHGGGALGPGGPPIAYLGDTVADVQTVRNARSQMPKQRFISLAVAPPHLHAGEARVARTRYEHQLRQAGADAVVPHTSAVIAPLLNALA